MLKNAGYILLTSLLLLTTVGFVISRHYCNNILVSTSLDIPAGSCNHSMDDDCCHNSNNYIVLKAYFVQPESKTTTIAVNEVLDIKTDSFFEEHLSENRGILSALMFVPPKGKNIAQLLNYSFLL